MVRFGYAVLNLNTSVKLASVRTLIVAAEVLAPTTPPTT